MSAAQRLLPAGFEDLEPLVGPWLLGSERERRDARCSSDLESLESFYGLMLPRMDAIIAHLDQWPLDALPQAEQRLLALSRSFIEVAPAVELFRSPQVPDGFPWQRFEVLT